MLMDFEAELKKLIAEEESPLLDPLAELAQAHNGMLEAIHKTGADISLQVEEVYDIIKEADGNAKEVKNSAKRETLLLGGMIAINDLLESLLLFIKSTGAVQTETIAAKREEALKACGLEAVDSIGQRLDPRFHTVASAEYSEAPPESVTRVLESGYIYRGNVIRKATVMISKGSENA